jgi:hypothetical protein
MRAEVKMALASLKGRMAGFLQVGLIDDEELYARELRGLRTQVTRTILALEKPDGDEAVGPDAGVGRGGGGVGSDDSGSASPVEEVTS